MNESLLLFLPDSFFEIRDGLSLTKCYLELAKDQTVELQEVGHDNGREPQRRRCFKFVTTYDSKLHYKITGTLVTGMRPTCPRATPHVVLAPVSSLLLDLCAGFRHFLDRAESFHNPMTTGQSLQCMKS